ncbi:MAG: nitroreductase family protein [Treponema sp.]|jgi:nitroreductase|nr:nitroreductase family protein [Treponema sp.]
MDTFEAVKKRYSYRGLYQNIPIPRDDLKKIVDAGIAAPSGCNKQTTSFIALDDPQLVNSVMSLVKKNGFGGESSGAGICVLSRQIPSYANICFSVQDYAAAIENMLIAAAALGYASCWIEGQVTETTQTQEQIARLLKIPAEYSVVAFLPIGIPEKEGKRPPYKPFEERAWYNAYGNDFSSM